VGTEGAQLYRWLVGEGLSPLARMASDNAKLDRRPINIESWIAMQNWKKCTAIHRI